MHSTVQTGLYTPNIFGYDYNYHNHPPPPNSGHHNHFPPPPHSFHVSKSSSHHNLSYQLAKHPPLSSAPPPSHHHPPHHHHHHSNNQQAHQNVQHSTPIHQQHHAGCKRAANKSETKAHKSIIAPTVFKSMLAINKARDEDEKPAGGKMTNSVSSPKFNFKLFSSINNLSKTHSDEKFAKTDGNAAILAPFIKLENKSLSLCSCQKNLVQKCDPELNCELCRKQSPTNSNQLKTSNSNLSGILLQQSSPKKSTSLNSIGPNTIDANGNIVSSLKVNNGVPVPNAIIRTGASIVGCPRGSRSSSSGGQAINSYKKLQNVRSKTDYSLGMESFKQFWQCTKPCGILTLVLGVILIFSSVGGFLVSLDPSICAKYDTCNNALVSISTISALVIGVVVILVGLVIIVYSKRDGKTSVIVTNTKHIDSINFDQLTANQTAFLKQPNGHNQRGNMSSSSSYNQSIGAHTEHHGGGGGLGLNHATVHPSSTAQKQDEHINSSMSSDKSGEATSDVRIRDENEYNANESIKVKVPTFKFNGASSDKTGAQISDQMRRDANQIRISISDHDHIDESLINEKTHLNSEPRS